MSTLTSRKHQGVFRKATIAVYRILNQIKFLNEEGIEKDITITPGNMEKIIQDYYYNRNRSGNPETQLKIPAIGVVPETPERAHQYKTFVADDFLYTSDGTQYSPTPVKLIYDVYVAAHKISTLMDIIEQIHLLFDNDYVVDIKYFDDIEPISTPINFTNGALEVSMDYGADDLRIVSYKFGLEMVVYLFKKPDIYNDHKVLIDMVEY